MSKGKFDTRLMEENFKHKDPFVKNLLVDVVKTQNVKKILEEFYAEIPKALIYGTSEQLEGGYDHDDVWIMMDLIKEWFGPFVPAKHRGDENK